MIDTDKYEGHSPTYEWMLRGSGEPELHHFADGDVMLTSYWLSCPATKANQILVADAPLILAAYDKQVRWINDILFRLEKMEEASVSQRLRFLLTVQDELEMMIK